MIKLSQWLFYSCIVICICCFHWTNGRYIALLREAPMTSIGTEGHSWISRHRSKVALVCKMVIRADGAAQPIFLLYRWFLQPRTGSSPLHDNHCLTLLLTRKINVASKGHILTLKSLLMMSMTTTTRVVAMSLWPVFVPLARSLSCRSLLRTASCPVSIAAPSAMISVHELRSILVDGLGLLEIRSHIQLRLAMWYQTVSLVMLGYMACSGPPPLLDPTGPPQSLAVIVDGTDRPWSGGSMVSDCSSMLWFILAISHVNKINHYTLPFGKRTSRWF